MGVLWASRPFPFFPASRSLRPLWSRARPARGLFRVASLPLLLVAVPSPLRGAAPGARCSFATSLRLARLGRASSFNFGVPRPFLLAGWGCGLVAASLSSATNWVTFLWGSSSPYGLAAVATQSNPLRAPLRSALANQRPLRASSRPLHAPQRGGILVVAARCGSPRSPPLA